MLLYLRRQVKTSKEAASLPFIERDYPEIRKEGTLRLLAGYGSGGEVQGGQLSGAIYELAKQLEKKSGLRVEVVLENRWDEALRHLRHRHGRPRCPSHHAYLGSRYYPLYALC